MAVNIPGVVSVVIFYLIILAIGLWSGRKGARASGADEIFIANRSLGLWIMVFTITASMVGGGYINGTAEAVAFSGFLWAQAPIGYCLGLIVAGILYCPKMREGCYVTMYDPFQNKYGRKIGALLFIPQLMGDLFWMAAILSALGNTMAIILDLNGTVAVVVSALVAIFYTFLGGLYSVAYTDVIQLVCIAIGLTLAFPFALTNEAVDLSRVSDNWAGTISRSQVPQYVDIILLLIGGGIPWQELYQRSLACDTVRTASVSALLAAFFSLMLAVPPILIGVAGRAADWNQTAYPGPIPIPLEQQSAVLPLALNYLCPLPVGVIGLGAVSAAVMSSADSCVLAAGTVFSKNVYRDLFRPQASDRELQWALRGAILVVGSLGTFIAVMVSSVYGLFVLCSDLMYVVLFPQLTCVLWFKPSNGYGCLSGFFISLFLRLCSGEMLIGLPPLLKFPGYSDVDGQMFPFRTFAMLVSAGTIVVVSFLTDRLLAKGIIPAKYDVLKIKDRRVEGPRIREDKEVKDETVLERLNVNQSEHDQSL